MKYISEHEEVGRFVEKVRPQVTFCDQTKDGVNRQHLGSGLAIKLFDGDLGDGSGECVLTSRFPVRDGVLEQSVIGTNQSVVDTEGVDTELSHHTRIS